jgi:hypothetical protein
MKMNKLFIETITLFAILLTFAFVASAQKVRYNYAPGTNFSKYKTYKWQRVEKAQYPNQILDEQIMRSVEAQLAAKGLRKTDTDPDLIVVYQAAVNQERQWNAYSSGGGYWGWGGWGGWGGMNTTTATSETINIGTLNVDFYDLETKKQIWRGEATKTLDPPKDPNKLQGRIDKAVARLLKNFPPRSDK